jgi:hypothetical protein
MSKIQRVTISVPAALRERMEAVKGRVNWSAVAARAFEGKLLELELAAKRGHMNKADILKRMQAAQEADTEDYEDGKAAGRAWAAESATPKELKRLAAHIEKCESHGSGGEWWQLRGVLATAIRPKFKEVAEGMGAFWEELLGDEAHRAADADFLRGFGQGAVEVWDEVSDEL